MTTKELKEKFSVYTDQISLLKGANAYWALLHYMIIFPDMCGALESPNGEATGKSYRNWASRYVADSLLSENEWYDIRCKILHQGITLGSKGYTRYQFVSEPDPRGIIVHRNVLNGVMVLDVGELTNEILNGLDRWFEDIANNADSSRTRNVENNIVSLATTQDSDTALGGAIRRLNLFVSASTSSNS